MQVSSWIPLVTGLIAGLGIGSAITAFVQHKLKKSESEYESQRVELEKRYRVIILLMYAAIEFKDNEVNLRIHRPDLKNQNDVLEELMAEWYNMLLFASEETQIQLHDFIQNTNQEILKNTAASMRHDLGRGSLSEKIFNLVF